MASCTDAAQSGRRDAFQGRVAGGVQHGGLEAGERKVQRVGAEGGAGEGDGVRVAVSLPRQPVNGDAAGVAEAEQAGALVERLPRRVVARPAQNLIVAVPAHQKYLAVAAGRDQADDGESRCPGSTSQLA